MTSTLWYNFCTAGYGIALLLYCLNLGLQRELIRKIATTIVSLAFISQTLGMVLRWIEAGEVEIAAMQRTIGEELSGLSWFIVFTQHPPWSNLYEIMVYMCWGLVLVFLITESLWRVRFIGIAAMILALVALGLASLTDGTIKPLVPALKSWWIMIHVISASIAYAAGTIGAIASFLFLLKAKEKITLSSVASGVCFVSVALLTVLGRGINLFTTASYKIKLLREMQGELIPVGKVAGEKFTLFYVESPFVGPLMIATIIVLFAAGILLHKQKTQSVPTGVAQKLFWLGSFLVLATISVILWNDLMTPVVEVPAEIASGLMPPSPWRFALSSNSWDLSLFFIVALGQLVVACALLWPDAMRRLLPEEEKLDRIAYANIIVSFSLVAVVLMTGALWAHYAWGRYWAWDPKETGALIIWLVYALYLHTRITYGWAGTRSAVIGVLAFFVILAGFLGVNLGFFADGLHSYGSS